MFFKRKSTGVISVLLLFALPCAINLQSQNKTEGSGSSSSFFTSKKIEIVQSGENIELTTHNGNSVSLPKVDKRLVDNENLIPSNSLLADAEADINKSYKALQEQLIQREEMKELSSMLGISINDVSLLDLYREVADWLGTRYRRGGMSRKAVDCSGFTNIIYKNVFDIQLDRVSTVIAKNVKESITDKEDLLPGDMVFFSTFGKKYINHVGVYIGEGKFIHASIKKGVIISRLDEGYYSKVWKKGGRELSLK
jgi:hypothetical protein